VQGKLLIFNLRSLIIVGATHRMLEHDREPSVGATDSSPKSFLTNIVSALKQHEFVESMAWHAHQLKNEAIFIGSFWNGLSPLRVTDSNGQPSVFNESSGESNTSEGSIYCRAGDNFAVRMKWDEAICAWEKSLDYYEPVIDKHSRLVATIVTKIGIAYYIKDDIYMAYESFQKALNIQETSLDPGDEDISVTVKNLWIIRVRMKEGIENPLSKDLLLLHVMNSLLFKLSKC
jgi:tetratricopeptide (TPR) repeat protein